MSLGADTTRANFDPDSKGTGIAIAQWAIRFSLLPETLPVFLRWARSIWPECPYTDKQIADQLVAANNQIHQAATLIGQLQDGERPCPS